MNIGLVELPSSFRRVLRFFRESRGTSTQTVNVLRAEGGETNIGVVIQPKGTGAFSLNIPDGTTTGGNARGTNAIDLQTTRSNADRVAFGSSGFAAGASNRAGGTSVALGSNNQASVGSSTQNGVAIGADNVAGSGTFCGECVAIGKSNNAGTSTSHNSAVAIGTSNNSSAAYALTIGQSNTASATNATAIGFTNTASGTASSVPGGSRATTNSIQGLLAYGFNGTSLGQNQMAFFGGLQSTTNTSARVTADAAAAAATNQLTLRNNSAFRFEGRVISRNTVNNDSKEWAISGLVKRGAAAVNTSLVGTPTVTSTWEDTGASAWAVTLSADTTNGSLGITIDTTGTTNAVRTTAVVWSTEVA